MSKHGDKLSGCSAAHPFVSLLFHCSLYHFAFLCGHFLCFSVVLCFPNKFSVSTVDYESLRPSAGRYGKNITSFFVAGSQSGFYHNALVFCVC